MQRRKKQPEETKRVILEAAGEAFSRQGYAGSGLGSIVAEAGMTKGALFHHFADKQALALAWIEGYLVAEMERDWVEPLASVDDLASLRQVCRARCDELSAGDGVSALVALSAELAGGDEVLVGALDGVFAVWRGALSEVLSRGQAAKWIHPSIEPEVEAVFLLSAFSGFTVTKHAEGDARGACARALDAYLETLRLDQA